MNTFLKRSAPSGYDEPSVAFQPIARYNRAMDFLLYLKEDCSYRADRVDPFLTVLWHPTEQRLVGIKIKGFRFLFERLRSLHSNLEERDFWPVVDFLQLALTGGMAEAIMERVERDRQRHLREQYDAAIELAKDAQISKEELRLAA